MKQYTTYDRIICTLMLVDTEKSVIKDQFEELLSGNSTISLIRYMKND